MGEIPGFEIRVVLLAFVAGLDVALGCLCVCPVEKKH